MNRLACPLLSSLFLLSGLSAAQVTIGGSMSGPLPGNTVYHVAVNGLHVPTGQVLTIGAGAILKFASAGILVEGALHVPGVAGNPVIFTSAEDDTAGGDTYQDGPTVGAPQNWSRLAFGPASVGSFLEHAEVRFGDGNNTGVIQLGGESIVLRHVLVRDIFGNGINLGGSAAALSTLEDVTINDCTKRAIINVHWDILPGISGLHASGNVFGDFVQLGLPPTGNVTIGPDNLIDATATTAGTTLDIPPGVTVTVEPGTLFKFNPSNSVLVRVFGDLRCLGTNADPVVFTSWNDDDFGGDTTNDGSGSVGAPGQWRGIQFTSSSDASLLEHAILRFAGVGNVSAIDLLGSGTVLQTVSVRESLIDGIDFNSLTPTNGPAPILMNCEVLDGGGGAYRNCPWAVAPGLSGLTASGNVGGDYVKITGGVDSQVTVGPANTVSGGPFVVGSGVSIQSTGRLEFKPGSIVKMEPGSGQIWQVSGELIAEGTELEPIVFTSLRDDTYAGDTQNDGGATVPAPGNWRGFLVFPNSPECRLENVIVRYAGTVNQAAVVIQSAGGSLSHVRVEHGGGTGFRLTAMDTDTSHCSAYQNAARGFEFISGTGDLLHATSVNNGTWGVLMNPGWSGAVRSSIAWGNPSGNYQFPSAGRIFYSDGEPTLAGVDGNLHVDPLFVAAASGDLHLTSDSDCIDAGDPSEPVQPDCTLVEMGAYSFDQGAPRLYCVSEPNSLGCQPTLSFDGFASMSSGEPFWITTDQVINQSTGILFYGLDGAQSAAFPSGTLCVSANDYFFRMYAQDSGGNGVGIDCSGSYAYDFNAHLVANDDFRLAPGQTINAQIWYRDHGPVGSVTTDAIEFQICP